MHGAQTAPTREIVSSLLGIEITVQTPIAQDFTIKDASEVSLVKTRTAARSRGSRFTSATLFQNGASFPKTQLV